MEPSEIYAGCRARLLGLGPWLAGPVVDAPLAATPPWKVLDGYRHLAGVCGNVLDGVLDGAGSPSWTAAQLAERAHRSLEAVCLEWRTRAPELDARVAAAGRGMAFVAFDAWTHEQDIRAAAGLSGVRDGEIVYSLAPIALASFGGRYRDAGAPPVRVVFDGEEHTLGHGDPEVVLRTSRYELLRIVFGRRSYTQVAAADWSGDRAPVIDAIHLFDLPERDIVD
jgi:uncharacterized protein (TIGR03083 family)